MEERKFSKWQYENNRIATETDDYKFVSSASILIAAGPKILDTSKVTTGDQETAVGLDDLVFPIAFLENYALSQNKQLQRLFEIGSKRSIFIHGRTVGAIQLSTLFVNGPNLLRSAMGAYRTDAEIAKREFPEGILQSEALNIGRIDGSDDAADAGSNDYFWCNLASKIFTRGLGLLLWAKDNMNNDIGALYCENSHIDAYQLGFSANATVVAESCSIQYDNVVPVKVGKNYSSLSTV